MWAIGVGLVAFGTPIALGHPDNSIHANPLTTPAHIVPEWYFLALYAILRSIPNKHAGVAAVTLVIITLFLIGGRDCWPTRIKSLVSTQHGLPVFAAGTRLLANTSIRYGRNGLV